LFCWKNEHGYSLGWGAMRVDATGNNSRIGCSKVLCWQDQGQEEAGLNCGNWGVSGFWKLEFTN
jgi:hypothetical protein